MGGSAGRSDDGDRQDTGVEEAVHDGTPVCIPVMHAESVAGSVMRRSKECDRLIAAR